MIQQFPVSSCLGVRSLVQNSSVRCQALCPGPRKAANEPSHLEPLWWTSWCMEGSMQKGWCKGKGLGNFSFAASAGSRWRFWFSGLRIGWMQDCNWKIKILLKKIQTCPTIVWDRVNFLAIHCFLSKVLCSRRNLSLWGVPL